MTSIALATDQPAAAQPEAAETAETAEGGRWLPTLSEQLDRPLSAPFCVLGWIASAGLFVALVFVFLGPASIDSKESIYSTWAIEHGQISCAYPAVSNPGEPPIAPLYPLLSGAIGAVGHIGDLASFPSATALGPGCRNAYSAMDRWYPRAGAFTSTAWIGCASWLALMAGVIVWLRASGRGRCGWEPLTLLAVASILPVWMCVQTFFHPQDLLALGLALCAMGCAHRDRWLAAGILCGLAVLSQQFALLIAAPLLVVAPGSRRTRFVVAGVVTGAVVVLPLAVVTSGHALRAIALGSGDNPSYGGTVLWETHAYGVAGVLLYRVAPIVASLGLSWWAARRLGPDALHPVSLLSLVAVSLGLRLVFEVNLITYYFMALAVALVLLDATRGSVRRGVVAWIAVLTIFTCRSSVLPFGTTWWGADAQNDLLPLVIAGVAVAAILLQIMRGDDRRNLLPWLAVIVVDLLTLWPRANAFSSGGVIWFWQLLLVLPGVLLAAHPLYRNMHARSTARRPAAPKTRQTPILAD